MGLRDWLVSIWESIRRMFEPEVKVVRRYSFDENAASFGFSDKASPGYRHVPDEYAEEVVIALDGLHMSVKRDQLRVPHEVTVLVPRAEIRRKYANGKLAEEIYTYSSITISHSPRYPERGGPHRPI